jgi:hypothetical protein
MEELVRRELVHTSFRLKDEDFYQMIDDTGGFPAEFKYVSFFHDGPTGDRYCKFTNTRLHTGWWTTICDRGQYSAWKFKQNMRARKARNSAKCEEVGK